MTTSRAEALIDLAAGMSRAGDSVPGDWTGFSLVAEITALGVRITGFRYHDDTPTAVMPVDTDIIDSIAALRTSSPGPNGELFDIYVARFDRAGGGVTDQAFSADGGAGYRVTAANVNDIGDLVRPESTPSAPEAAAPEATGPAEIAPTEIEPTEIEPTEAEPTGTRPTEDELARNEPPEDQPGQNEPAETQLEQNEPADDQAAQNEAAEDQAAQNEPAGVEPAESLPAPSPTTESEPDPSAEQLTVLTADIVGWATDADEPATWDTYAGVVYRLGRGSGAAVEQGSLGFAYGPQWAVPHVVGGDFHAHLRDLLAGAPEVDGAPPGAALLRLLDRQSRLQARFVYPPASDQIRFTLADDALAARIRPRPEAGAYGLRPRREPDRLDAAGLQKRIEADVTASLRSIDPWRTFALAYDVPRGRVASFVYGPDGRPEPFIPPLSPLADLSELRDQTGRPDGAKWAGVVVHAWPSGRVDLTFYGEPAVDKLLGGSAEAAGPNIRPLADPPEPPPRVPWPASGGHLDRDALAGEVTAALLAAPDLGGPDWDRLAVVITLSPLDRTAAGTGVDASARAVRFYGERGPGVVTRLGGLGPVGKLSRAVEAADAVRPAALVLRGHRGARLDVYGFEGEAASRLAGGDERMVELADWLRPA